MFNTTNNIYKLGPPPASATTGTKILDKGISKISVVLGLALFHQQITHLLKIAVAFVKIWNLKTPTLCMVSRLRPPNLRAECRNSDILLGKNACLQRRHIFPAE